MMLRACAPSLLVQLGRTAQFPLHMGFRMGLALPFRTSSGSRHCQHPVRIASYRTHDPSWDQESPNVSEVPAPHSNILLCTCRRQDTPAPSINSVDSDPSRSLCVRWCDLSVSLIYYSPFGYPID